MGKLKYIFFSFLLLTIVVDLDAETHRLEVAITDDSTLYTGFIVYYNLDTYHDLQFVSNYSIKGIVNNQEKDLCTLNFTQDTDYCYLLIVDSEKNPIRKTKINGSLFNSYSNQKTMTVCGFTIDTLTYPLNPELQLYKTDSFEFTEEFIWPLQISENGKIEDFIP